MSFDIILYYINIRGRYNKETCERTIENTKIILSTGEYDLKYPKIAGRINL